MSDHEDEGFGFAPEHDRPIPYMQRISGYYQGLGYGAPYRWAHYAEVPFAPLQKPLAASRIGLITTAAPYQPGHGDQGPGAAYNSAVKFYEVYSGDSAQDHDLRISHIAYDRDHTTAEDPNTWFPLPALRQLAAAGKIGAVAPRFHGAPTNRSHRTTLERDCLELLKRVRQDAVDAVVLAAV
ncbi:MAG TPA: glycine/sarcosine/betaine reductase selenoprotein B family protein [Stellaceae bacterium]|nr:glycine/sarcosine/betaine reductase selenoprotein B family protein [Stellaceae bacterium]